MKTGLADLDHFCFIIRLFVMPPSAALLFLARVVRPLAALARHSSWEYKTSDDVSSFQNSKPMTGGRPRIKHKLRSLLRLELDTSLGIA